MKTFNINILGEDYTVHFVDEQTAQLAKDNSVGSCSPLKKEIYVLNEDGWRTTLIHEILHAFFIESGLVIDEGIHTEANVYWISNQLLKIVRAFEIAER